MSELAELIERLRRADDMLRDLALSRAREGNTEAADRLIAKASGVALARSYAEEMNR